MAISSKAKWFSVIGACSILFAGIGASAHESSSSYEVNEQQARQLQAVKSATDKYHDVQVAVKDGYQPVGDCVNADDIPPLAGKGLGTMGIHYFNPDFIDNKLNQKVLRYEDILIPTKPELLLYTRDENGNLVLTGVEYMVSHAEWKKVHGREDDEAKMMSEGWTGPKPSIFGYEFEGLMAPHGEGEPYHFDKHIWLHSDHPGGLDSQWNSSFTCHAPDEESGS